MKKVSNEMVVKVRNWFANRGLEFTPDQVRYSLTVHQEDMIDNLSSEAIKLLNQDPTVDPFIQNLMNFIHEVKIELSKPVV